MSLDYEVEIWFEKDRRKIPQIVDLFDAAVRLNYQGVLEISKVNAKGSVQIIPKHGNIHGIYLKDNVAGRTARITTASMGEDGEVKLTIGEEEYHIFYEIRGCDPL